jgi:hypothetical protein
MVDLPSTAVSSAYGIVKQQNATMFLIGQQEKSSFMEKEY